MSEFYETVPVVERLEELGEADRFVPLPDDWHVLVTDIRDSTRAISRGLYKDVNLVGASSIVAILNALGRPSLPFSFGGDGICVAVPDAVLEQCRSVLLGVKIHALTRTKLDLRVGTSSVRSLRDSGTDVLVARFRASKNSVQAVFAGGGVERATDLLKDQDKRDAFLGTTPAEIDLSGLECRWTDLTSRHGEIVCLIVKSLASDAATSARTYRRIIGAIRDVYGSDSDSNPVTTEQLRLTRRAKDLKREASLRASKDSRVSRKVYEAKLQATAIFGGYLMRHRVHSKRVDWGKYKDELVQNTDVRRFVDSYRQLLSGTSKQRDKLLEVLASETAKRRLVYGVHLTDRVQMTCMVHSYSGNHLHFVDGADGGFTAAAKDLKERMKQLA